MPLCPRLRHAQDTPWYRRDPVGAGRAAHATTTVARLGRRSALLMLIVLLTLVALVAALTTRLGNTQSADAQTAATSTSSMGPEADAYISGASRNRSFGRSVRLTAGGPGATCKVSYLRFNLAATRADAIQSAKIVLTRDAHHLSGTVSLFVVASVTWKESTLTAANAPALGALIQSKSVTRSTNQVSFNVTNAVRGKAKVTFAVKSSRTTSVARFHSREAASGRPKLTLVVAKAAPTAAAPTTAAPTTAAPTGSCTISVKLVPSCGRLFGIAPRQFTTTSETLGLAQNETNIARQYDIVHSYHRNGELFPNAAEKALALQPGENRLLFLNWKPATDMTWQQVANGGADARIDAEAAYLKSSFPYPFFLTIWHEPENDVNQTAGAGKTAADYAAMFRHVVLRLRADGATKAVTVMDYMGYVPWAQKTWFSQLWPGNDIVDWIGIDPYASGDATGYNSGDFNTLVNRKGTNFPGFYTWAITQHPGKPMIVAEWGVKESTTNPTGKATYFNSVANEIGNYPNIRAVQYFDTPMPPEVVVGDTRPDSSPGSLAAYKALAHNPAVDGPRFHYASGAVAMGK